MSSALTLLIVLIAAVGISAYQFKKGSLIRACFAFIAAVCAGSIALGFYELLTNFIVTNIGKDGPNAVMPWLYSAFFLIIFLLAFAILQTLVSTLLKSVIEIGEMPEKIGRAIVGLITGYYIAGIIITALVIAPLPDDLPNKRLETHRGITLGQGNASALGAENFAIAITKLITGGSLSSSKNIASIHPYFLDEMYLNRSAKQDKPLMVGVGEEISVSGNIEQPEELQSTDPNIATLEAPSGQKFVVVPVKISGQGASLSMGQIRLLSKSKEKASKPLTGASDGSIALGFLTSGGAIKNLKPFESVDVKNAAFDSGKGHINLVFAIPAGNQPTAVTYKLTELALVPPKKQVTTPENPAAEDVDSEEQDWQ